MRPTPKSIPVSVLAGLAVFCLASSVSAADWIQNDVDAALREAKKTGKPIFVTFRCER